MIYVKYFGAMAAELGTRIETLPWSEGGDTVTLVRLLRSRNDRWNNALAENKIYKIGDPNAPKKTGRFVIKLP